MSYEKKECNTLRGKRGALELTQKQVAERMGITQVQYQQYESRKHKPGPINIKKLAIALEMPEATILNFFN